MKKTEFHISIEDAGKRVDVQTAGLSGLTRSRVHHLIEKGLVLVNQLPTKTNYKTKYRDIISITIPDEEQTLGPENIPLEILHADDFLMVVNKPHGMVIYPAAGHSSGTLLNAIAYHSKKLASVGGHLRPGVVHRLDKDTSGVMVVALEDSAYYSLVEQFRKRSINRKYKALIYGSLKNVRGEIALKIGRSESDRKKMSTKVRKGKESVTGWKVIEHLTAATLIEAKLGTGRTHQIRVHFASIGHPVLGDKTYGGKTSVKIGNLEIHFPRQMLHAELIGFVHPATGEYMEFISPVPQDMETKIEQLRRPAASKH